MLECHHYYLPVQVIYLMVCNYEYACTQRTRLSQTEAAGVSFFVASVTLAKLGGSDSQTSVLCCNFGAW